MAQTRFYEDLSKIHINTEAPRAHYFPYDSLEKALKGNKYDSKYYTDLNGVWDFKFFERDIDCPDIIDSWSEKIKVPSCWQTEGYEKPGYTNINYPYPVDPPYVPDDNPVGVYRRTVTVTAEHAKSDNYIIFEGASPCVELYVNGLFVGFSTVSHSTSEFKVVLHEGENEIIAKVYKFCVGSYLEDQDFFRFNGIFRDVYLLSRPKGHIFDLTVKYDDKTIECEYPFTVYDTEMKVADLSAPILWNAEKPYLYTVVVEQAGEFIPVKVGMRSQSVNENGELLINGVSVKLKGVNHHDTHPTKGYTMSYDDMKRDLLKMKELNINCIRTSHYPPQPVFLELCDELGFYVVDEADNETHGFNSRRGQFVVYDNEEIWPCKDPAWKEAHLDRVQRLFERDKNHTCVIMWSMGNEANYGPNIEAMCLYTRSKIAEFPLKRLVHYENVWVEKKDIDAEAVDVVSRMYPTVNEMKDYLSKSGDKRPVFLCEYSHAMGNGPGDLKDYWDHFYSDPQFIGGCIWEWTDHVAPNSEDQLCYGGDFGEETHDGNFCCDGLTLSDRSFKAGSYEAKKTYQPMTSEWNSGALTVYNRFDFTHFSGYDFKAELTSDGITTAEYTFTLNTKPHSSEVVALSLPECNSTYGTYLNLYMYDKNGNEIAFTQHLICEGIKRPFESSSDVTITTKGEYAYISGSVFNYRFNTHYGYIEDIDGFNKTPLKLTVWRAPTDNDMYIRIKWQSERYNMSKQKVYRCVVQGNSIIVSSALVAISRIPIITAVTTYTFFADGSIKVDLNAQFSPKDRAFLPRLGFEFATDKKDFTYFGYGPLESYCDMHGGSKMGMYSSTAEREYVNYIMPQEHGNHYDVKYFKLGDFEFIPDESMEINVSEYSSNELTVKAHNFELEKDGLTHVRVDYKVSGIGSNSCGPEINEKYRLTDENIKFGFTIKRV